MSSSPRRVTASFARFLPDRWAEKLRAGTRGADTAHGVAAADFFAVVYGRAPNAAEQDRLRALVPGEVVGGPREAHRVLMAFDAQSYPTAFAVRATASLEPIELDGFTLWLDRDDASVSAVIADRNGWEAHVSDALASALRPGSTFVDVGANVGYHTFLAASIVGPGGTVIAVEPSPENCRLLELSKIDNDAEQVTILPLALDRSAGLQHLTTHIGTNAGLRPDERDQLLDGHGFPVLAVTLDDLPLGKVDVMKIDVEGAEFRVLEGGRSTIERDRPLIVMEFSREMSTRVSGGDPTDALRDLVQLGYDLFVLDKESNRRIPYASADELLADWDDEFRIEDLLLRPR